MTAFILTIIVAALFMVLNIGNFSNSVSSTKLSLQQEARKIIEWITKDVRQTAAYQISNNDPSTNHIKFKVCLGHDGADLLWSSDFIEYTYDPTSQTLVRFDYASGRSWQFNNVVESPFNISQLITDNLLIVTITVQKQALGSINPSVSLAAEIKIRNG